VYLVVLKIKRGNLKMKLSAEDFRKLSKEEQEKIMETIRNPPDNLPIEYTDESIVSKEVLNWTPEQVEAYNKQYERISKY
jgi:hypothetical protein